MYLNAPIKDRKGSDGPPTVGMWRSCRLKCEVRSAMQLSAYWTYRVRHIQAVCNKQQHEGAHSVCNKRKLRSWLHDDHRLAPKSRMRFRHDVRQAERTTVGNQILESCTVLYTHIRFFLGAGTRSWILRHESRLGSCCGGKTSERGRMHWTSPIRPRSSCSQLTKNVSCRRL